MVDGQIDGVDPTEIKDDGKMTLSDLARSIENHVRALRLRFIGRFAETATSGIDDRDQITTSRWHIAFVG